MSIGIGITTRNRSDYLKIALHYFLRFMPEGEVKIVVIDDNSDDEHKKGNMDACDDSRVFYSYNMTRKGVARSKNECLKNLKNCDYVFLFDDDCFPQADGWANIYIEAHLATDIHHFIFIGPPYSDEAQTVNVNDFPVWVSPNAGGVLMFLTKTAIQKVGGYNQGYKNYGYEHSGYSNRVFRAQLTNGVGPYISLPHADSFFWSMDFHKDTERMDCDGLMKREDFRSSVHGEDLSADLSHNGLIYQQDLTGKIKQSLF